jgi:hypothetical protein
MEVLQLCYGGRKGWYMLKVDRDARSIKDYETDDIFVLPISE